MKTILFDAICRVGIFLICARTVVHFRPKGAYEKYLKLLVSAMVLIQLLFPMSSFFTEDGGFRVKSGIEFFTKEFEKDMEEIRSDLADTDSLLRNMTLRQVRAQTKQQEMGKQEGIKDWETIEPVEIQVP